MFIAYLHVLNKSIFEFGLMFIESAVYCFLTLCLELSAKPYYQNMRIDYGVIQLVLRNTEHA